MSGRTTFVKRGASLREPVGVALEPLRAHKLRSFLMLLGIILSVCTLIVLVALIEGANRYIAGRVANMGSNVFLLTRFGIITDRRGRFHERGPVLRPLPRHQSRAARSRGGSTLRMKPGPYMDDTDLQSLI
jgi:hypothetical protein